MPPRTRKTPDKANADALNAAYANEEYAPEVSLTNPDEEPEFVQRDGTFEVNASTSPLVLDSDDLPAGYVLNADGEPEAQSDPVEDGALEIPDAILTQQAAQSGGLAFEEVDEVANSRSSQAGQKYAPAVNAAVQSLLSGRKGIIRVNAEPGKSLSQVVQLIKNVFGSPQETGNGRQITVSARSKRNYQAPDGTVDLYIVASWGKSAE